MTAALVDLAELAGLAEVPAAQLRRYAEAGLRFESARAIPEAA